MKKYNLSNIMKRAWELVKKAGMTISSGLKKAWKEAKGMAMRGTEKQIAWAMELVKNMNEKFDALLKDCPADKKEMWISAVEKYNNLMNEAYAGDVIDLLKDNKEQYYGSFYQKMAMEADLFETPLNKRIRKEIFNK